MIKKGTLSHETVAEFVKLNSKIIIAEAKKLYIAPYRKVEYLCSTMTPNTFWASASKIL
jgi:hypothetical protein